MSRCGVWRYRCAESAISAESLSDPQRQPEQCTPPQPKARTIAIGAGDFLHPPQRVMNPLRAQPFAPFERTARVVLRETHRDVDVFRTADSDLCGLTGEIDDHRENPGCDEARGILDDGHGEACPAQEGSELRCRAVTA